MGSCVVSCTTELAVSWLVSWLAVWDVSSAATDLCSASNVVLQSAHSISKSSLMRKRRCDDSVSIMKK